MKAVVKFCDDFQQGADRLLQLIWNVFTMASNNADNVLRILLLLLLLQNF